MVAYRVNVLYQALQRAYRLKDVYSKVSEWPLLVVSGTVRHGIRRGGPWQASNLPPACRRHA
jgi:hypothetical protein